jgi:hypothetical protein
MISPGTAAHTERDRLVVVSEIRLLHYFYSFAWSFFQSFSLSVTYQDRHSD